MPTSKEKENIGVNTYLTDDVLEDEAYAILNAMSDGVLRLDKDCTLIWHNESAHKQMQDALLDPSSHACFWCSVSPTCEVCPVKTCMDNQIPVEEEVVLPGGKTYQSRAYPFKGNAKYSHGVLLIVQEVTKYKQLMERMQAALDAAENITRLKHEFLAHISDDLRTPLNRALGMLDLLMAGKLTKEQRELSEIVVSSCEKLLVIINNILEFSKLHAEKIVLEYADFNLHDTIKVLQETFQAKCRSKNIRLDVKMNPDVPSVIYGDEARIRHILFSVMDTAIELTQDSAIEVEITFSLKEDSSKVGWLGVVVHDVHFIVSEPELKSIFDPFIQLNWDESDKFHDKGMVLASVNRLIKLMGGDFFIGAGKEKGTTLSFHINIESGSHQ